VAVAETPRTCRCGCGDSPKRSNSEFCVGHAARVGGLRGRQGMHRVRGRGFCGCGCGERVLTPGAGFRHGHYARTAESRALHAARSTKRAEFRCQNCRRRVPEFESHKGKRKYCGPWCKLVKSSNLPDRNGMNDLQKRLFDEMVDRGKGIQPLAREIGIKGSTVRMWLKTPGRTLNERDMRLLADHYGIPFNQAIAEAGGLTAEKRMAKVGRENAARYFPKVGTEEDRALRRKGGLAQRGKKKPRDAVERGLDTRRKNGDFDRWLAARKAASQSPKGRVTSSLIARLRHEPAPSPEKLRDWAADEARRRGLLPEAVYAIWRPHLQRGGLASTRGRKRLQARHGVIVGEMTRRGLTPADRMPKGFWTQTLEEIARVERSKAPDDPESVRQWWIDHKLSCLSCRAAVPTGREA
jgi:hypothetical protein